jgi:nucleoside-diphosphate-sugar epimerase
MKYYGIWILCVVLAQTGFSHFVAEHVSLTCLKKGQTPLAYVLHVPLQSPACYDWENFHCCAFTFPNLLQKAAQEKMPVLVVVPQEHHDIHTTGSKAPLYEGARVALAWASAQWRFNTAYAPDIRVLLVPSDYEYSQVCLQSALFDVLTKPMEVYSTARTPEKQFQQRLFALENVNQNLLLPLSLESLEDIPVQDKDSVTSINPQLPAYEHPAKRILITGGAGFIGSHLARTLLAQGHQVIVLDNLLCATKDNISELEKNPYFAFFQVDVSQPFTVEGPLDLIIHAASVPSPAWYYRMPVETLQTGLHATEITLELARQKQARYLFASTSEVYGDPQVHPQPEEYCGRVNPIGKRSQYDQSKRGAETLLKLYFERYGIDIRIARIFNTYGPGMQLLDGRVVTNFVQQILEHKPFIIYGCGNQTRSFCYITDMVDGLLGLAFSETLTKAPTIQERIFNVGNPVEFTINELAHLVDELIQRYGHVPVGSIHIENSDYDDPKIRRPNITRITALIGFSPQVSLPDGLEKTLRHFLKRASCIEDVHYIL